MVQQYLAPWVRKRIQLQAFPFALMTPLSTSIKAKYLTHPLQNFCSLHLPIFHNAMLINFDRRIAQKPLSGFTKVHSLIAPYDLPHLSVWTVHDCGKRDGLNRSVLSKKLSHSADYLGLSLGKVETKKSRFRSYFGPLVVVSELIKERIAFNRLLLKYRSFVLSLLFSSLTYLYCPRFLNYGQISNRFSQGLKPVELWI